MSMEHWWNDTDRGKGSAGRKKNIQCVWSMNERVWNIGGMILTRESDVLGEKHYKALVGDE